MPIAFEHGAVRRHYRSLGNVLESWEELFDGLFISTDNWKFMPHQQGWGDLLTWVPVPSTPSRSHRLKKLYWGILILTLGFRLYAGSAKLHSAQSVKDIVENYINNYKLNSTHCNHVLVLIRVGAEDLSSWQGSSCQPFGPSAISTADPSVLFSIQVRWTGQLRFSAPFHPIRSQQSFLLLIPQNIFSMLAKIQIELSCRVDATGRGPVVCSSLK